MIRRLVTTVFAFATIGASIFILAGCDGTTTSTSGVTTTLAKATTTTLPLPIVGYLDPQPVDLTAITNLGLVDLTLDEYAMLASQSFVAVGMPAGESPTKFWSIYEDARYRGLPVLITTDSLLNAYHGLFDSLLQLAEEDALYDQVETMTDELYSSARELWSKSSDSEVQEDAHLNSAYFAVAAALLDPETALPTSLRNVVNAELALIGAAEGPAESPCLGYSLDYSQFKPRGHYTRTEKLQRYFRAMMWYGNTGFYINPRDPDITEEEAVSLTRRAVLIAQSLAGNAKEAWMAIYEPTKFIVGESDDLTVTQVQQVIAQVFGTATPEPDELAVAFDIARVQQQLNEFPAPLIQSALLPDLSTEDDDTTREENQRNFRLMGQRYIPDAYAFQQLVWANVGTEENKRTLPMGLDVMSILGSDEAYRLETRVYGQGLYADWYAQLQKVKREFAVPGSELWPDNLYTGWLESLPDIMDMPADDAPAFMRSQPWALKSLNTALGSWTELRHDTILYAKQSVTAEGEGGEEPLSLGYVEPYPAFYDKIADLTDSLAQAFDDHGLLDRDSRDKLQRMASLARALSSIASKELTQTTLTDDEMQLIQTYGQQLESLEQFGTNAQGLALSPTAEKSPVVADVHTDYVNDPPQALEEATGYPLYLYAAFELDGSLQLFVGASYSYYEFAVPVDQRLTDEDWIALLDSDIAPSRPEWTDAWIVQRQPPEVLEP